MVDFRKWFLALAIVALLLGSAVTASAQITTPALTCTSNAGATPTVRAEGLTELVGDVVLNCTGGVPTNAGVQVPGLNFQIFLNTNITSRLYSSDRSEALLIVDDPPAQLATGTTPGSPGVQVFCSGGSICPITGVGTPGGVDYRNGTNPNVFQGRRASDNSLVWTGVPIDPPGSVGTRIIRITNVRANANQLGVSSTLIPSQIVMFISATGSQGITINNPQQVVAFVTPGLAFSLRQVTSSTASNGTAIFGVGDGLDSAGRTFFQCNAVNKDLAGDNTKTVPQGPAFWARFREGFASSFKHRGGNNYIAPGPTGSGSGNPNLFTESGFTVPAFGPGNIGLASNGTRLMLRFSNIPAGVSVFVGTRTENARAVLLSGVDANGDGQSNIFVPTGTTSFAYAVDSLGAPITIGIAPITVSGGTATAVYEVVPGNDPNNTENFQVPVVIAYSPNTANNLPGLGNMTVTGSFAPLSTVGTQSETASIPRFADVNTARTGIAIIPCRTNLLFPYVTSQFGFDTGIAIVNTSQDPFGTSGQSGACTINFYGLTVGGGAAPPSATTRSIAPGGIVAFTIGTGLASDNIPGTPQFGGYIIAQCNFQFAHGFAFITDGPIGQARVAEGYLALVLDPGGVYRDTKATSEALNN